MISPDDTQPRSPFKVPPQPDMIEPQLLDEPAPSRGPGCLVWGILGVVVLGFALVITLLAGLAGWTSGQRTAQTNATATQGAAINEQLSRLQADINSGNLVLLQARLDYLVTLTPGIPGLDGPIQTATAVFLTRQPTSTIAPSATLVATTAAPTAAQQLIQTTDATQGFDLASLLEQARSAVGIRDWDEAIDLLDVILGADSTYETATVRSLMSQALTSKAYQLFRTGDNGDLAEAIIVADRAAQFGDIGDLSYERYIATLYLDALNSIGTNYPKAIQALSEVYNQVPNYRDVRQLLFNQYVAYGDAWVAQGEFCPAVGPYQSALTILSSGEVSAKRSNAETMCSQATPVGAPLTTLTPGAQPIAPVGQPGT